MGKKIRGRVNKSLGDNALRDYLANHEETAKEKPPVYPKHLVEYCDPIEDPEVLLINPPITIPKYMQKRCIPPMGISYVAASLRESGIQKVSMYDCCVEGWHIERENKKRQTITYGTPPSEILANLGSAKPNIVGISVLFSTDLRNLFETSREIKRKLPDAIVVVGGLHPTIYPKEIMELDVKYNDTRTVDFIIRGEGEFRFVEFINNLKSGNIDLKGDGVVGYHEGELFVNYQRGNIKEEELDNIPFPAYDLLPIEKYFKINVPFSPVPIGDRVLPMLTTRGCPVGCTFCANTNTWKKHRKRSVGNIMEEVRWLKREFQIDEIQFADDNLTYDNEHAIAKFTELKGEKLSWCTPNGTMVNKVTPELIEVMKESGLYQITLSIDSANARTLKELHHKPCDLNTVPGLIEKCRELGIFTHGTLVVGMPTETLEEIVDGFEYVKEHLAFTSISTFIAAPIPGSELYHDMLEAGRVTKEEAREIDTTKSKLLLSNLDANALESAVEKFQGEFLDIVKKRSPEEYQRKYRKLIDSGRWDEAQAAGKLT